MGKTSDSYGSFVKVRWSALLYISIIGSFLFNLEMNAQNSVAPTDKTDIKDLNEKVYLQTDRDIYIIGEQVWFKVYKMYGLTQHLSDLSKVVYVELLDKNNFPLKQIKVQAVGATGYSVLNLPENISSGNYFIRAYTSWMKNFSIDNFYYKEISVINPFETIDHIKLSTDEIKNIDLQLMADSLSRLLNSGSNRTGLNPVIAAQTKSGDIHYTITEDRSEYPSRGKVKIEISATDVSGQPLESDLLVSVTKSVLLNTEKRDELLNKEELLQKPESINLVSGKPHYLPELEGHIISGFLRLKVTNEPLSNTNLSLSFVGKTARCQFGKTDNNGEFYFLVKEQGVNEIVIQPLSPEIKDYYVELNQSFSGLFGKVKPSVFYLDSSKVQSINNVIISAQINNIYQPFRQKEKEIPKAIIPDFYGKPENTIKMSDYIELTSVREVVKEIIPDVYTLKQNGKYDFKLINKFRGKPFENKPLILVDGVPVYDFEKVLNINSKEIERADVINTRYFFSENIFDGIVSFVTIKGNLSAMEFDNSIFRQVYEGCQLTGSFYSPDYSIETTTEKRIPDFRNTLYWNPDLRTNKNGKTSMEFYTSDESAEYTITVEGMSAGGKSGSASTKLYVK